MNNKIHRLRAFIFRHKIILLLIILLILPVFILLLLRLSNFISTITGIDLYVSGVSNGEMFIFLGSYIGGVITLSALYFTITENRKAMRFQLEDARIDKELEYLADGLSKLNSITALKIFTEFNSLVPSADGYKGNEIAEIKCKINFEREQILSARIILSMKTTMLDKIEKCSNCKNQCRMYKIKSDFIEKYYETECKLYKILASIERYISDSTQNLRCSHLKRESEQLLNDPLTTEVMKELCRDVIKKCDESIKDTTELIKSIEEEFEEIVKFHNDEHTMLLYNSKNYHFERKQRNYKSCFAFVSKSRGEE